MEFKLLPGGAITGEVRVPGDKSISHRSIMLGALARGTTRVSGFLEGEDALATVAAFRAMGVEIEGPENGNVIIVDGAGGDIPGSNGANKADLILVDPDINV